MAKAKYKVKLTPGNLKKGKAAKNAENIFLKNPNITPQEKNLIKSINENDMIQQIVGNCRIDVPGMFAMQKSKSKKSGKSSNKNDE